MTDTYQHLAGGGLLRLADGVSIPPDERNTDYRQALAEIAAGATVADADPDPIVYGGRLVISERIRTTNAAPAELYRATLAPLTGYRALLNLLGVDAGNGALRSITASVVAKRLNNGAVLVGAPVLLANHQDAAASAWDITPSVAGNDFVITVTGAAGRNIDWLLDGSVNSFTPGGQS